MNLKTFLLNFVFVYVLISLPSIVGIGYVIDWVPEATLFKQFKGYVIDGLLNNFVIKNVIAIIVGFVVTLIIFKRQQTK
ncbi:hypothetical protein DRW41_10910 [Neobacillus piezotolerans]|uniref:Uncharacterized protein n=2 Tax=Neobacillus piezotolerans TaxID=2259171 RepID=A0A3D8GSA7_9BACI|nr:hypothetical protein DRW41_10910 [Neobacillus piezotolerans]